MREIVPLQGIVQGRGGLVLGSIIPCTLFYFFKLYLKRTALAHPLLCHPCRSFLLGCIGFNLGLDRMVHLISLLGLIQFLNRVIISISDWKKVKEGPYDESTNLDGVIQLGLAENRLSLDLVQDWLAENTKESIFGGDVSINEIATYQPSDGLMELKVKPHLISEAYFCSYFQCDLCKT